ncbi:ATP-binding protein [Bifidobacterium moukalabense]|uniref:AAA ATPase domain protein n=1 Tax=Bifidobacterium moukalabense DSM 27321 TaxID=1435051 RepID=W4N6G7_9BIFI|nr:ATP-binding protein [Bifidobacterium moukalabense]ETY70589.1 AAA ATPase domain protein [Bifidobacterium moukalabense DSM 27321]
MAMNPFKPTAGKMPPILIGRETAIKEFTEGLDNGAGAPGRIMLVTGQRGFGKTVLLTEFRRIAAERGWETISETASPDVAQRLIEALTPGGLHVNQASVSPSVSIPGIASASLGRIDLSATATPLTLRNAIAKRLESGKIGKGKGILITIDETQAASLDDLVAIATAVQHVTTSIDETDVPDAEKKGIAIVFAGLPSTVNDLINDAVITFLRRALRCELDDVPLLDVKNAFLASVADSGKTIGNDEAWQAARATNGYPYMVQLVGYYMWQSAQRRHATEITADDVATGIADAQIAFDDAVCAPALDGLKPAELEFLHAMARDVPSATVVGEIETRTGRSRSWVNKYRAALIKDRIIQPSGHGSLEFAVPHLGAYLRKRL